MIKKFIRGLRGFFKDKSEILIPVNKSITSFIIGQSLGGREIECFQINNGEMNLLFTAGIHGNEIGTIKLSHKLINWLVANRANYQDYTFYVIPCLNPDGFNEALKKPDYFGGGRFGRLNKNKVDLNRNFETPSFQTRATWTHGKNYSEETEVFAGNYPNSEPEIKAFTKFVLSKRPKVIFSFHNAGCDIVGNDLELAQKLAKKFAEITGYLFISPQEWKKFGQTGSSCEWSQLKKIPILEIEAKNRWQSDWINQKNAIVECLKMLR